MKDGIYLLRFTVDGAEYARRVLVDGACYRFIDENNKVLPGAPLSVSVALINECSFEHEPDWEEVVWHRVEDTQPDDGITVLISVPDNDSNPVWPGYLEADVWHWASGSLVLEDVVAWAEMPTGLECAS